LSLFRYVKSGRGFDWVSLSDAVMAGDPILIYGISDNSSPPKYLWWIGLP
jgi:hypothetical protein